MSHERSKFHNRIKAVREEGRALQDDHAGGQTIVHVSESNFGVFAGFTERESDRRQRG